MSAGIKLDGKLKIELFEDDNKVLEQIAQNTMCVNGLTDLAAALSYLGVQDIATNIGVPESILTPIYGAIGSGTTPPSVADTQLTTELFRTTASGAGFVPAFGVNPSQIAWQFQFPINNYGVSYSITEAGIFTLASSVTNYGDLVDHALFSPAIEWSAGQSLILSLQVSLFAVAW